MPLSKAIIINTETRVPIPVMFNPPDYRLQKTNQFAEIRIPGLGSTPLQFVAGNPKTLTLDLFFDTTDRRVDVRLHTEPFLGFTAVNRKTHAPPTLLFIWGSLAFPCVLESVTEHYEHFDAAGMPLRAQLTVTLKGYDVLEGLLASIPLESADRAKIRTVRAGDTLQSVAAEEYGDPRQWRPIAEASQIDDPLAVQPGQLLRIPPLK